MCSTLAAKTWQTPKPLVQARTTHVTGSVIHSSEVEHAQVQSAEPPELKGSAGEPSAELTRVVDPIWMLAQNWLWCSHADP